MLIRAFFAAAALMLHASSPRHMFMLCYVFLSLLPLFRLPADLFVVLLAARA